MIDPRFYEHRERDPLTAIIGAVVISLMVFVTACWLGAIITSNQLKCPGWLAGSYRGGAICMTGPINGLMWNVQYRAMPSPAVRRSLASWPRAYRRNFFHALDASLSGAAIGVVLMIIVGVTIGVSGASRTRNKRVLIEGTRFWANDEEVFSTGLAVNYRPPLLKRLGKGPSR